MVSPAGSLHATDTLPSVGLFSVSAIDAVPWGWSR
jgi:hypothetical protein